MNILLLMPLFVLVMSSPLVDIQPSPVTEMAYFDYPDSDRSKATLGIVVQVESYMIEHYEKTIAKKLSEFKNSIFFYNPSIEDIEIELVVMSHTPSPREIIECFCDVIMQKDISVIVFMPMSQDYMPGTGATQYFLQLTHYLRIPVIAWIPDNYAFAQKMQDSLMLQMAPSIQHQAAAMLEILRKFNYHHFSLVTSHISGHSSFVLAINELVLELRDDYDFKIITYKKVNVSDTDDVDRSLSELKKMPTRIILLHSTVDEAHEILARAAPYGLIGREFLWIVTESAVAVNPHVFYADDLPIGLIGIHFDKSTGGMMKALETGIKVFLEAMYQLLNANQMTSLKLNLSCYNELGSRWKQGPELYQYLKDARLKIRGGPFRWQPGARVFKDDATMKQVTLEVVNRRENQKSHRREWQNVGSWLEGDLDMKEMVWLSGDHKRPLGIPEKYHLKVSFIEEPPFLTMRSPYMMNGTCHAKDIVCRIPAVKDGYEDPTGVAKRVSYTQCCSGFTVDLLNMLAKDLNFTFEMNRAADGLWGAEKNGRWNGIIAELMHNEADIGSAVKINMKREEVIDFSVPFIFTGISIVVRKRMGIISPQAILEPFDVLSWILTLVVCVQAAAVAIFLFEYVTPVRKKNAKDSAEERDFTLFQTLWLVWAMLLGATVSVLTPRGTTAKFVASTWAIFSLAFNAIYTANMAAFLITREDYYHLAGVTDDRLVNPSAHPNPLRFGVVPSTNTETILNMNFPEMSKYMKNFSRSSVIDGVSAVKNGELDAFLYDAIVLDYLVGQNNACSILTVGKWYSKGGYGFAFPKLSQHLPAFNDRLLYYSSNGDMDRLINFWFRGACHQGKMINEDMLSNESISLYQFMSAFLLLGCGILLAAILVAAEMVYDAHLRKRLFRSGRSHPVIALLSQNLASSLIFTGAVSSASKVQMHAGIEKQKCPNPFFGAVLWTAQRKMNFYRLKAMALEAEVAELKSQSGMLQQPAKAVLEPEL